MTKLVKNKILLHLNYLKSIGYKYHENLDVFPTDIRNFKLPNNILELGSVCEHCHLCELSKSRKSVLFGYGNTNSKVMFITDEPTDSENEIGMHYTGKSGELLKNMIENVLKVKKEEVYITSLVKCKSTNGVNLSHVDSCNDYLLKQIDLIKPEIIVLLGEKTYSHLMKSSGDFSQIRGKELIYNNTQLIATFSASYLLRNPSSKKDAYYDMIKIKNLMERVN